MNEKFVKANLNELDKQNLITLSVDIRQKIKDNLSKIRDLSNNSFRIDVFTKSSIDYLKLINISNNLRLLCLENIEMIEKLYEIKNVIIAKNYKT